MKSKGLQKLRWFCQVCEKQCRDENGFKCHIASESHLRQMLVVGEHAGRHIADYSSTFQGEFVKLLSRRFGTKRVKANNVYQEYIQDKSHLHMNSTRWVSLTEFIKFLGRAGIAHVDETEKGWFIAWIDNSPKALAKQASAAMKERSTMSDEQMERLLIAEQIGKAKTERNDDEVEEERLKGMQEGFKRDEAAEKVVLSFNKPKTAPSPPALQINDGASSSASPIPPASEAVSQSPAPTPIATSAPVVKVGFNAFKANPLKPTGVNPLKANVFKTSSTSTKSSDDSKGKRKEPISVAEQLIFEDQQRKRRKMDREAIRM